MYIQLTWARLTRMENWSLIEKLYDLEGKEKTPGLKARWVARNVDDPESFFGLTLWESLADLEAWEISPQREQFVGGLRPLLVGSIAASVCEVRIEDLGGYARPRGDA